MIYNRPYMSGPGQEQRSANALTWLIGINVGVFFLQCLEHALGSNLLGAFFTLSQANLHKGFIWTLETYSFLHSTAFLSGGGFLPLHIIANMLGLFFLGRALLPELGTQKFLQLYFGATAAAGIVWWLTSFATGTLGVIGASGAVSGLLVMFACLYPNREIYVLLFFILPIKIKPKVLALAALAISLIAFLFSELGSRGSGVAHSAHLGGMLGGWLFFKFVYLKNIDLGIYIKMPNWLKRKKGTPSKQPGLKYKVNITQKKEIKAEVDRILDKINTKGFGSLTAQEKQTLDEARELLNRR